MTFLGLAMVAGNECAPMGHARQCRAGSWQMGDGIRQIADDRGQMAEKSRRNVEHSTFNIESKGSRRSGLMVVLCKDRLVSSLAPPGDFNVDCGSTMVSRLRR